MRAPPHAAALVVAMLTACTVEPPTGQFIGDLGDGADAMVGVALGIDDVSVFFAGLGPALGTYDRFYDGPVSEDRTWSVTVDGWQLDGEEEGEGIFGTLTDPDGAILPWQATRPTDVDSIDGLYRADDGACGVGAIVFNSGGQAQGTYCPSADEYVELTQIVAEGGTVTLASADTGDPVSVVVTRVEPP